MKIFEPIKKYFQGILNYIESEKELFKLRVYKQVGSILGNILAAIFLIILFHIVLAMGGIWLGVWLGGVLDSYAMGFGLSALVFIIGLVLVVKFRNALLVQPMIDSIVDHMVNESEIQDQEKKEEILNDE